MGPGEGGLETTGRDRAAPARALARPQASRGPVGTVGLAQAPTEAVKLRT